MELEFTGTAYAGENDARSVHVSVDAAYRSHEIRLAFLTPAGKRCVSPALTLTQGACDFTLPACLLDAPGLLLMQILAENDEGQVVKSEVAQMEVARSVPTEDAAFAQSGLVTLGGLENALAALTETVADCARTGDIPTVPTNVSAFLNDADYVSASAVDTVLDELSTNPVQNKAIARALATAEYGSAGRQVWYGKCDTAAGTAMKIVDLPAGYVTQVGTVILVKFKYANTADYPSITTLPDGAETGQGYLGGIKTADGTQLRTERMWAAGETVAFIFTDGWRLFKKKATTNDYGLALLSNATDSSSKNEAATPFAVKKAYDLAKSAEEGTAGTFTLETGTDVNVSNVSVRQVGCIVHVTMQLTDVVTDAGNNGYLGHLGSVDLPVAPSHHYFPCVSWEDGTSTWHTPIVFVESSGYIGILGRQSADDEVFISFSYEASLS